MDNAVLAHAKKLSCSEAGYKSLAKSQREGYDPLFRQKITLDDAGNTPVKIFDEKRKRLTSADIAALEWRDIKMDINLSISSVFVNAGNWGCVATPHSILVKNNEQCEFSDAQSENSD